MLMLPSLLSDSLPLQSFSAGRLVRISRRLGIRTRTAVEPFSRLLSRRSFPELRPQWFVMENVATIRNTRSFKRACDTFREAGYGLTCKVLNAAYCGVPQIRKRMFVIGGIGEEDNFLDDVLDKGLSEKPLTIRDYLGDSLGIGSLLSRADELQPERRVQHRRTVYDHPRGRPSYTAGV